MSTPAVTRADFQQLADLRLKEAKALLDVGMWDGAYYLAGYAVEVALKARICRVLNWLDFPSTEGSPKRTGAFRHMSWTFYCVSRGRNPGSNRATSPCGTSWRCGRPSHATMLLGRHNRLMQCR